MVFDTPVFWGNSQPGAIDQEDLVMTRKMRKEKYQGANDVMDQRLNNSPLIMIEHMLLMIIMCKDFYFSLIICLIMKHCQT